MSCCLTTLPLSGSGPREAGEEDAEEEALELGLLLPPPPPPLPLPVGGQPSALLEGDPG